MNESTLSANLDRILSDDRLLVWGPAGWELTLLVEGSRGPTIDTDGELEAIADRIRPVASATASPGKNIASPELVAFVAENFVPVLTEALLHRESGSLTCSNCWGRNGFLIDCHCDRVSTGAASQANLDYLISDALGSFDPGCAGCAGTGQRWNPCPMCHGSGHAIDELNIGFVNPAAETIIVTMDLPELLRRGDVSLAVRADRYRADRVQIVVDTTDLVARLARDLALDVDLVASANGYTHAINDLLEASITLELPTADLPQLQASLVAGKSVLELLELDVDTVVEDLLRTTLDVFVISDEAPTDRRVVDLFYEVAERRSIGHNVDELVTRAALQGFSVGFSLGFLGTGTYGPEVLLVSSDGDQLVSLAVGENWEMTIAQALHALPNVFASLFSY